MQRNLTIKSNWQWWVQTTSMKISMLKSILILNTHMNPVRTSAPYIDMTISRINSVTNYRRISETLPTRRRMNRRSTIDQVAAVSRAQNYVHIWCVQANRVTRSLQLLLHLYSDFRIVLLNIWNLSMKVNLEKFILFVKPCVVNRWKTNRNANEKAWSTAHHLSLLI